MVFLISDWVGQLFGKKVKSFFEESFQNFKDTSIMFSPSNNMLLINAYNILYH